MADDKKPSPADRRVHPRGTVSRAAQYSVGGVGGEGRVWNISRGGMCLNLDAGGTPKKGDRVMVLFDGVDASFSGEVAWAVPAEGHVMVGLTFSQLTDLQRAAIDQLLGRG